VTPHPYQAITASVDGAVATLTLNRPERRNAIGPTMVNELLWGLDEAARDDAVRVIVLTGAGKAFSAGGDFSSPPSGEGLPPKGGFADLLLALVRSTKPVIARVNGIAFGGGLGLVAASHFAVATDDARLGTPEVELGLFPFMIYAVLERVVPRRRLVEMMLLGEKIGAEEARSLGLLSRVVPAADLDAAVADLAGRLAGRSPSTLRLGLEALRDVEGLGLAEKLPVLAERLAQCLATDDAREGLLAFFEKRQPRWTGR